MTSTDEINKFSMEIENLVQDKNVGYIESICDYCERTGLEVEVAAKLISRVLKSKIHQEARDLHCLKRSEISSRLPV